MPIATQIFKSETLRPQWGFPSLFFDCLDYVQAKHPWIFYPYLNPTSDGLNFPLYLSDCWDSNATSKGQ